MAVAVAKRTSHSPNPARYTSGRARATVATPNRTKSRFASRVPARKDATVTAAEMTASIGSSSDSSGKAARIAVRNGYVRLNRSTASRT